MAKTDDDIPSVFFSRDSQGRVSLIHQGMPLCAPTTQEGADAAAQRFKFKLPLPVWNGAEFEPPEKTL